MHARVNNIINYFQLENAPTPERFYNDYIKSSRAAIFRKVVSDTKAAKLWNDVYLKRLYGNLEVRIEGKREKVVVLLLSDQSIIFLFMHNFQ